GVVERLLLATALVAFLAAFGKSHAADFRHAFLQDYEPHAKKLHEFYTNIRVRTRFTTDSGKDNRQIDEWEAKFNFENFLLKGKTRIVEKNNPEKTIKQFGETIEGRNPSYSFSLTTKGDREYVVSGLKIAPSKELPITFLCFP